MDILFILSVVCCLAAVVMLIIMFRDKRKSSDIVQIKRQIVTTIFILVSAMLTTVREGFTLINGIVVGLLVVTLVAGINSYKKAGR